MIGNGLEAMKRTVLGKLSICLVVLGVLLCSSSTMAGRRGNPRAKVLQLNQRAMAAYANLQIGEARKLLQKAVGICEKRKIDGDTFARTYVNLGIVEAGGRQDNAAAMDYFRKALCLSSNALLDPLNSTPEIETLFNMAKNQARVPGGCAGGEDSPPPTMPTPHGDPPPTYRPGVGQPPQSNVIRHQPVTQQLRLVPVPIFVETNPSVRVGQVLLFYRTLGERIFQQVLMNMHGRGYAATIGCDVLQTFDPTGIEYYVAVFDRKNQLLGTTGTEAQPHRVAIVQSLSATAPSLPDEPPPVKCVEECPPWNPGCNDACENMGSLCDMSSDCCAGLVCKDETCVPGEKKEDSYSGDFDPLMRIVANFGTGTGLVPGGKVEPYNQTAATPDYVLNSDENAIAYELSIPTAFAWSKFHFRVGMMFYLTDRFMLGLTFRGGLALDNTYPNDVMPLAPTVVANVAFRLVGKGTDRFELDLVAGLGGGIIQHRIPYSDCKRYIIYDPNSPVQVTSHPWYDPTKVDDKQFGCHDSVIRPDDKSWDGVSEEVEKAYFRQAKAFVAELGFEIYVWFTDLVGLNIGLMTDLYVPTFALNGDVQLGLAFRF